jgi:aspartate/tyrosine/aromatic aminotransferase
MMSLTLSHAALTASWQSDLRPKRLSRLTALRIALMSSARCSALGTRFGALTQQRFDLSLEELDL